MSFSIEIVPPSSPDKVPDYEEMLAGLADLQPTSVAVTLGAGQTTTAKEASLVTLTRVQNQMGGLPAIAHLTGLYETKASVTAFLERLRTINVHQIMALRGGDYQADRQVGGTSYMLAT
ncbi:methylenetetrahydrofolate reductase [Lentilactobacillus senioris]|uniref:methylenetetrahydrofolate reductase n=1 Tax=Lentilactobacillus senioris TaxID=931534 RepID=UPI0006D1982A|nr:methylenetetrahydrofolate reductase [Lentilactobacillus senioris]